MKERVKKYFAAIVAAITDIKHREKFGSEKK